MSSPNIHSQDQYPNALEVIRQITNLTQSEDYIYRGESSINFEYHCSSTLYRQLRKENVTPGDIPGLLKQRQEKLIKANRKYKKAGDNDLEKLMWFRHFGDKVNLLDFTKNHLAALFFACFEQDKLNENGLIIVKRKSDFKRFEIEDGTLPDREIVLLEPQEDLERARDQHGVFLHAPEGRVSLNPSEVVLIKSENKREILSFLEKANISDATMFRDAFGEIERRNREDEEHVAMATQSTTESTSKLQGFAKPKNNRDILTMEYYMRLMGGLVEGVYSELLKNHTEMLIAGFTSAIDSNSRDAIAYFNRGLVYHSKPNPDYDEAISDYTRALELDTGLEGAYNNRGNAYAEKPKPDYDKALSDYNSAIKQSSDLAVAYNNRGNVHKNKLNPDYERAIADYDHSLKLNPSYAEAYYNRGNAYSDKPEPNYDQAISDYNYALKLNPNYAEAYHNRGNAYINKQEPDYVRALSDYNRTLTLNPDSAKAYNNRGNVHAKKPNPDYVRALLDYNQALKLNPNYAEAYHNRGATHMNKPDPDYDQAILDYDQALSLASDMAAIYHNRGSAYVERPKPDYDQAIRDYTYALSLNPNFMESYYCRGRTYMFKPNPDYDKADKDFSKALELNPKLTDAYCLRALVCMELGDYVRARRNYDTALKIEPEIAEKPKAMAIRKLLESHNE